MSGLLPPDEEEAYLCLEDSIRKLCEHAQGPTVTLPATAWHTFRRLSLLREAECGGLQLFVEGKTVWTVFGKMVQVE